MRKVKIQKVDDKIDEQSVLCPLNCGSKPYCVSDCAWFGIEYPYTTPGGNRIMAATCRGKIIGELLGE